MAPSASFAVAPNGEEFESSDRLVRFPRSAQPEEAPADDLQLLEDALTSLQTLYDANAELTKELDGTKAALAEAERLAEKWQKLATAAMVKAKDAEARLAPAEQSLQAAEQRAAAAERKALETEESLARYKERFAGTVQKFGQVQDIITATRADKQRPVAGTHFRIVRTGTGWGD